MSVYRLSWINLEQGLVTKNTFFFKKIATLKFQSVKLHICNPRYLVRNLFNIMHNFKGGRVLLTNFKLHLKSACYSHGLYN